MTRTAGILSVSFFAGALFFCQPALAQEELPIGLPSVGNIQDPNQLNINEDKPLLYEPARTTRDSVSAVPARTNSSIQTSKPKAPHGGKPSKAEEDALSFNFLYYIIQKFKFSDIIDQ